MKHHDLELIREQNRKSGSHPFLIVILFLGLIAGLVTMGSQSSQRNGHSSPGSNPISGLFAKP